MKKFLVTGFESFDGQTVNPTHELIKVLNFNPLFKSQVTFEVLPVSFENCWMNLKKLNLKKFDGIILMGQAAGRSKISFERVALNWNETIRPDNDGVVPPEGPIDDGPLAYLTNAPISNWKKTMDSIFPGLQEISLSAGSYVCNNVYYRTCRELADQTKTWSVFIHVPFMEEQGSPHIPLSMQLSWMEKFLSECVLVEN
ncbi:MAG: pyroglutamyl-peptidase I [Bdellovibrionota bacterium]